MAEYISREAANKWICETCEGCEGTFCVPCNRNPLKDIPAADVVEVRHGRWIRLDAHRGLEQYKCSVCRSECYVPECMGEPMYEYCPNCGAKMDGGQDDV